MKLVIECSGIGISSLVEAVNNKLNDCVIGYENTKWEELKRRYLAQEISLRNIMAQIIEQVNNRGEENDS